MSKIKEPLVTVNILSFNRKKELQLTLTKVFEQDYKNIEVIIADNASTDGTIEMLRNEFPDVQRIELSENIGIRAYDYIMRKATGKYFLILDDDSFPGKATITSGVLFLESNPKYSIITFKIVNQKINEVETKYFKIENPYFFHGCGSIWKNDVYKKLGGYDPDYFLYYNEIDLSIRCYNNGMKIKYFQDRIVYHQNLRLTTNSLKDNYHRNQRKYEQYFTGHIRFLIKHFNLKYVNFYAIKWIINRFIVAIFYGYYFSFLKSLVALPKVINQSFKKRNPVIYGVQKYYRFGNIHLIDRDFFPNFRKTKK